MNLGSRDSSPSNRSVFFAPSDAFIFQTVFVIFSYMRKELKDIRFITLPEERKIGEVSMSGAVPLPIQFPEGSVTEDIDFNSIVAGLIEVVAWDPENNNIDYYKQLLLELQPDVVKELNLAAIAQSNKREYEFAEELMLAVNHLSDVPESYINLAVLYAQMTVDLHRKNRDTEADMYDDKILAILNECKEKHPDYAPTYSEISAFHMRHGDVESARDFLAKYTELEQDKKKREEAMHTLKSIEKMLSSKDQIMYAYDKMMMGCPDDALEIMDKYIASNEKSWEAFFLKDTLCPASEEECLP